MKPVDCDCDVDYMQEVRSMLIFSCQVNLVDPFCPMLVLHFYPMSCSPELKKRKQQISVGTSSQVASTTHFFTTCHSLLVIMVHEEREGD